MKINEIVLRPAGTQMERIIAVCHSIPEGEVIGKRELMAAASITGGCYNQIAARAQLDPYRFKRLGIGGNLWGKPSTIAKLRKMQAGVNAR